MMQEQQLSSPQPQQPLGRSPQPDAPIQPNQPPNQPPDELLLVPTRVMHSRRRCFNPGCDGWITAEFHGAFRYGKVTYRQYMNCHCDRCGAESPELIRSQVEGQPEVNGPRFLLHDPEFDCLYEVPGFGQSMLPFIQAAKDGGSDLATLLKPMFEVWLRHYRREYLAGQEC